MSGGAAVVGAMSAIAMNKLPVHVRPTAPQPTTDRMNAVCPSRV